jgi:spore germination cell wall hydrolase CwlJ-like protein
MTLTNGFWKKYIPITTKLVIGTTAFLFCAVMVTQVTQAKMKHLREANNMAEVSYVTTATRERQLACLAKNIYYEAGSESFEGKVAVAQVTINRANSGDFPSDICGVIYQKSVIYSKVICQFSWYCEQPGKMRPMHTDAYNESMAVAKKVLLENFRLDGLKTAMYYHADYVNPGWGKEKVAKIGRHIFYSNRSAKGSS